MIDSISEESDTCAEWHVEGRRLVPPIHRHVPHAAHTSSSNQNASRSERPVNLRSAAAMAAAAPVTTKQGLHSFIDFLPNVHCYFMKHVLLRDIYCFCITSAFIHCRMCNCHMSLKDLLTYLFHFHVLSVERSTPIVISL